MHKRTINALENRVWALHPDKLEAISEFVAAQIEGRDTGTTFAELAKARSGGVSGGDDSRSYDVRDGVAVIPVMGVMERRMNLFSAFSGGSSSQLIAKRIRQAAADSGVQGILLDVDSPGGSVFAVEELQEAILEAKEAKAVVAHTYALMCSAAYWIAAQCDHVVIGANAEVGSIGVAVVHYDRSEADRSAGVKRTVMTAGRYKRMGADNEPLSHEASQVIQGKLDTYYSSFVDAVAKGRGVSFETVLADMADGRTFIGDQARQAGLVDRIGTIEDALALARGERRERMHKDTQTQSAPAPKAGSNGGDAAMTKEQLQEQLQAAREEGVAAGVDAERARVLEILEAGAAADMTKAAVQDGSPALEIYKRMTKAEAKNRAEGQENLQQSLDESAGQVGAEKGDDGPGYMELVTAYQKDKGCSRAKALVAVSKSHPEAHAAYIQSQGGE